MELPQIGRRCCKADCKRLDFLPCDCRACGQCFCGEHATEHALVCEHAVRRAEDAEPRRGSADADWEAVQCEQEGCEERCLVAVRCERCGGNYCVPHRHGPHCSPPDLEKLRQAVEAPRKQFKEAKARAEHEVDAGLARARKKGGRGGETAARLQLMRLKDRATGNRSVPQDERVYFLVHGPGAASNGLPVWVGRQWSVGRAVDACAAELRLANNNNVPGAPRLALYAKEGRRPLCEDMTVPVRTLLELGAARDGDSLELCYGPPLPN